MKDQQLLRDSNSEPTMDVIAQGLGLANDAYISFMEKLKDHDIQINWRYYKDGNSWLGKGLYKWSTAIGTQKETTAFWLSVWDGFFKVTLYIPEKHRAEALALPLSNKTEQMVEQAKQIGKLKFFPLVFDLHSGELFDELFILIDFRKKLK